MGLKVSGVSQVGFNPWRQAQGLGADRMSIGLSPGSLVMASGWCSWTFPKPGGKVVDTLNLQDHEGAAGLGRTGEGCAAAVLMVG